MTETAVTEFEHTVYVFFRNHYNDVWINKASNGVYVFASKNMFTYSIYIKDDKIDKVDVTDVLLYDIRLKELNEYETALKSRFENLKEFKNFLYEMINLPEQEAGEELEAYEQRIKTLLLTRMSEAVYNAIHTIREVKETSIIISRNENNENNEENDEA